LALLGRYPKRKNMAEQTLMTSIELMQPVVMTPPLQQFPPGLMAHCDQPGHLFVRLGGVKHGMDTLTALRLLRDLRLAVEMSAGWPPA
jgi:hypothetical protein